MIKKILSKDLKTGKMPYRNYEDVCVRKATRKGKEILIFNTYHGETYLTVDEIMNIDTGGEIIKGWVNK